MIKGEKSDITSPTTRRGISIMLLVPFGIIIGLVIAVAYLIRKNMQLKNELIMLRERHY